MLIICIDSLEVAIVPVVVDFDDASVDEYGAKMVIY